MTSPFPPPTPGPPVTPVAPVAPEPAPRRKRRLLVGGAVIAVIAVIAAVAVVAVVLVGGDDGDSAGDATIVFAERWQTRVDGLGDVALRADLVEHDDDVALFVRELDGDGEGLVLALDPATGDELWSEPVGAAFGPPTVTRIGDVVLINSVAEGLGRYDLVGHDARTGDRVWSLRDGGLVVATVGDRVVVEQVVAPEGESAADVVIVDAATGDEIAERGSGDAATTLIAARDDGLLLAERAGDGWQVVGLDLDGEERWTRSIELPLQLPRDVAAWSSQDVAVFLDGDELVAVDVSSGEERWSERVGSGAVLAVSPDEEVVVSCLTTEGDAPAEFEVFDLGSGDELRSTTLDGDEPSFVGFSGPNVLTVTGGAGSCQPSASFVFGRTMTALDARTGEEVWSLGDGDGFVETQPAGPSTLRAEPGARFAAIRLNTRGGESRPSSGSLYDPVTGEAIVDDVSADGSVSLYLAGRTVVGTTAADETFSVFDASDPSIEVGLDDLPIVAGYAAGTLYLVVGSEIVAFD